jgi:hypothetical protein
MCHITQGESLTALQGCVRYQHVERDGESPILFDRKDRGYTNKDKFDVVWETAGKELN